MRGIPRYTLVWGARDTLGARYLSKNTVILKLHSYLLLDLPKNFCPSKVLN